MPCQAQENSEKKTLTILCQPHKSDAYESRRCRINEGGEQKHEGHIADRGHNSMSLYNLVQQVTTQCVRRLAWMTTNSKTKNWDQWKKSLKFARTSCENVRVLLAFEMEQGMR